MAMFQIYALDEQIKALPTVDTASGAIATFDTDLTENLVSVKCQIVAKQASGTPSPINPLPITAFDDLTLYHNDINLWNEQWERGAYDSNGEKSVNTSFIRSITKIAVLPNTTYYFKTPTNEGRICYYDIGGSFISRSDGFGNNTFTTPNNCHYITFFTRETGDYGYNISINYPSTDTQYHAFNGAYIPFGQTVANGVLDITTGKLRVTHACTTLDSSLNWMKNESILTSNAFVASAQFPNYKRENGISSHFETVSSSSASSGVFFGVGVNILTPLDMNLSTSNDFKQWISNNTVQVLYSLLTPIEIQLDSITLQALLNENNIWCDTGDTEVKYLLTVGKKIS